MKRRRIVGGILSLSAAGCLRLTDESETTPSTGSETATQDATVTARETATTTRTESETGTTRSSGVRSTLSDPPEPFVVGRSQRIVLRVSNNRDREFDGEAQLRVDGALRAIQSLELRSRTATTVSFELTIDALQARTIELTVAGEGYEVVLFDDRLQPAQHVVTVDWGASYVPAEDPDSDNPEDDRSLSFYCTELVLERDGAALATYDIGVFEEEPRRLEGKYSPEDFNGDRARWFGTPGQRTVLGFEDGLLREADALRFVGTLPPVPNGMPVTARVGERQTDEGTWANSKEEYVVSVEVGE
jgi:hypothetical protein